MPTKARKCSALRSQRRWSRRQPASQDTVLLTTQRCRPSRCEDPMPVGGSNSGPLGRASTTPSAATTAPTCGRCGGGCPAHAAIGAGGLRPTGKWWVGQPRRARTQGRHEPEGSRSSWRSVITRRVLPAVPARLSEPLWDHFAALLPCGRDTPRAIRWVATGDRFQTGPSSSTSCSRWSTAPATRCGLPPLPRRHSRQAPHAHPTLDEPLPLGRPHHHPTPQVIHLPVGLSPSPAAAGAGRRRPRSAASRPGCACT